MQQYAATGTAYLNLAKLKRVPDSLRDPGPSPSLAGDLQIVEDMSAQGQAQIYFTLKPGRSQQLMHFDAARGQYSMLQQPWCDHMVIDVVCLYAIVTVVTSEPSYHVFTCTVSCTC